MITGFIAGTFDLFHAGHVNALKECKEHCDYLIVGLQIDPSNDRPYKNKPIQTSYERYLQLDGSKYVDKIIPYDTENDLQNLYATLTMDMIFLGIDHQGEEITGHRILTDRCIGIVYISRYHNYSSTNLREIICHTAKNTSEK